jgi:Secretion system C-terminal sorting domain
LDHYRAFYLQQYQAQLHGPRYCAEVSCGLRKSFIFVKDFLRPDSMKRSCVFFFILFFGLSICSIVYSQDVNYNYGGIKQTQTALLLLSPGHDSTGLTEVYNSCAAGLNYVQTSWKVTSRYGSGSSMPANFTISGIPPAGMVIKSFAWWTVSYQSGSSASPQISITTPSANTFNYTAQMSGQNINKCWGEIGTRTFRADITSAISGNGSYVCNISGNTVWEIDGVTILTVYIDSTVSKNGRLIIDDGCLTYGNLLPDTVTTDVISNFNACLNSDYANAFTISSDQQNNIIPPNHSCIFNSDTVLYPNTFWNFDIDTVSVASGQTSFGISIMPNPDDCWTWAVSGLYYQTDSCDLCVLQSIPDFNYQHEDLLSIYPNPAVAHFYIERSHPVYTATLELLDCFGKSVYKKYWASGIQNLTIDVSGFSSGLYLVKLAEKENLIVKKVLIQH